jgi:hypothetical protein
MKNVTSLNRKQRFQLNPNVSSQFHTTRRILAILNLKQARFLPAIPLVGEALQLMNCFLLRLDFHSSKTVLCGALNMDVYYPFKRFSDMSNSNPATQNPKDSKRFTVNTDKPSVTFDCTIFLTSNI